MASTATPGGLRQPGSRGIAFGIDHAVEYWLGRIEQELTGAGLTAVERLGAIERLLHEYKEISGKAQVRCASA